VSYWEYRTWGGGGGTVSHWGAHSDWGGQSDTLGGKQSVTGADSQTEEDSQTLGRCSEWLQIAVENNVCQKSVGD
jgi:hypothetical protein